MLHFARLWEKIKAEGIVMRSLIPLQDLPIVEQREEMSVTLRCNNILVSF